MFDTYKQQIVATSALFAALFTATAGGAQEKKPELIKAQATTGNYTPADAHLYTNYQTDPADKSVSWVVAGYLPQSSGAYGSGTLPTFGKVGSMIETSPVISGTAAPNDTVTRDIGVLDIASGVNKNGVVLSVFQEREVISPEFATVSFSPLATVSLPALKGGAEATALVAATPTVAFISTTESETVYLLNKSNLAITALPAVISGETVSAITTDPYGFVTVNYGSGTTTGFAVYDTNGKLQEDGGGATFMLNTQTGTSPAQVYGTASPALKQHPVTLQNTLHRPIVEASAEPVQ